MADRSEHNSCYFQGLSYPEGSEVGSETNSMVCREGVWRDADETFENPEDVAFPHFYH